jgi:hypothetical protein
METKKPGKKQGTRLIKVVCPDALCGVVLRMTRKHIDNDKVPTCACGARMQPSVEPTTKARNDGPPFHAVKEALRNLAQAQGLQTALLCVTDALGPAVAARRSDGLVTRKGGIGKLLGSKSAFVLAPGEDHIQLYAKDGQPYSFVAQPYGVDFQTLEQIVTFCKQHGLTASISGESSHSIGRAVRLEYRKVGTE